MLPRLRPSMDWDEIVTHLAQGRPALVVDRARRVRFANAAMQELLGFRGEDFAARGWMATCVLPRDRGAVQQLVASGMGGAPTDGELPLVTRDGRRLALRVGLTRETCSRAHALVIVVESVRDAPVSTARSGVRNWDCSCDVSRASETPGIVEAIRFLDPSRDGSEYAGEPIGTILHELGCAGIDQVVSALLDPACSDLVHVMLPDDHSFCVVTARAVNETQMRVTVRYVDARVLPAIVEAKVKRVAEAGGLSDRERQVLQLLLRGRGLEDIATTLEIAPRTVKFHQANVLQKLGAGSRLDLLRVVL